MGSYRTGGAGRPLVAIQRPLCNRRRGNRLARHGHAVDLYFEVQLFTDEGAREAQIDGEQAAHNGVVRFDNGRPNLSPAGRGVPERKLQIVCAVAKKTVLLQAALVDEVGQLRGIDVEVRRDRWRRRHNAQAHGNGEKQAFAIHGARSLVLVHQNQSRASKPS